MDSGVERLEACYQEVLEAGEQLLNLLAADPTDEGLARAEALLGRRDALAEAARALIAEGHRSEAALRLLQQVVEQQRRLETALQQRLGQTRQTAAGTNQARGQLQSFVRVLGQSRPSTILDQRR